MALAREHARGGGRGAHPGGGGRGAHVAGGGRGAHVAGGGRGAQAADLLVGLGSEPEGSAGRSLAAYSSALTALADRAGTASPRLPALEVVLGWAAGEVGDRPAGTVDLLLAALEVGSSDLADLLDRCGLPAETLRAARRPAAVPLHEAAAGADVLAETYGLDPGGTEVEPAAARAAARTRAVGGGTLTLLAALAVEAATDPEAVPLDPDTLAGRLAALPGRDERTTRRRAGDTWDTDVEAVLDAAWRIRRPGLPLRALDLLRSAALVGGRGPRVLLASTDS